jgi:hypothetical protein
VVDAASSRGRVLCSRARWARLLERASRGVLGAASRGEAGARLRVDGKAERQGERWEERRRERERESSAAGRRWWLG